MVITGKIENEHVKEYIGSLDEEEISLALMNKLKARVERRHGRIRVRRPVNETPDYILFAGYSDAA